MIGKRKIILALIILFCGVTVSHYLEPIETEFFVKIRNLIYFSSTDSKLVKEGVTLSKYKGLEGEHFNPVHHVQTVWPEIYSILSSQIDEVYYNSSGRMQVDTSALLMHANKIMKFADTLYIDGRVCYRLPYNFPEVAYNMEAGWYSGMAQGLASELMIASYLLSKDTLYLNWAKGFVNLLNIDIPEGGVKVEVPGGIWFEEYAQDNSEQVYPLVLNGHIFAVDGLYALTKIVKDESYNDMLFSSVQAVEENIFDYVIGGTWSKYDLVGHVANRSYHDIHIQQLKRLIFISKTLKLPNTNMEKVYRQFDMGIYFPMGIWVRLFITHNNMLLFMIVINSILITIVYLFSCGVIKLIKRQKKK